MIEECFLFYLPFLRYLNFCHDFFGYVQKWLYNKGNVNLKVYDVTSWKVNSYNTILPVISRSKGNETMKSDQFTT